MVNMNNVIVIGSDHHNTLGVVESLGMAGLMPFVILVANYEIDKSFVSRSKYCKGRVFMTTYPRLIALLHEKFGKNNNPEHKSIVITTNDEAASLLDNHYQELSDFLVLSGTGKQGELDHWMNKPNMVHLAESIKMNVPLTRIVKRGEVIDEFVFPCMTKSISTLKGGKSNIRVCENIQELNSFLSEQTNYPEVQVQQLIDKDFEFQFIGCSIHAGEEVIIPGRTHIVRPNGYDNTFHLKYVALDESFDDLLKQTRAFIRQIGYSGLFSIEFIRDKSGVDYFLEMNFRNDGNAVCVTASGTNLPYLWYLSHVDEAQYRRELERSTFKPVVLTPFEHYFYNMIQGEVTFGEWLRNNFRTTQFAAYFKDDTAPFWHHLKMDARPMLAALANKVRNRLFHRKGS